MVARYSVIPAEAGIQGVRLREPWIPAFAGMTGGGGLGVHRQAAGAVAASGIACFVDYQLTPKRLTPGFEHRLAKPELAHVYACFAAGLLVGTLLMKKR